MVEDVEKQARSYLATYTPSEAKMRIEASTVLLLCKLSRTAVNHDHKSQRAS